MDKWIYKSSSEEQIIRTMDHSFLANINTVIAQVNLLDQAYVLFRLPPVNRNLRNEISASRKICFYNNGIRDSPLANYNPLKPRNDARHCWENFLVSERMKYNHYHNNDLNTFFWRNYNRREKDYVEEYGGQMHACEFR